MCRAVRLIPLSIRLSDCALALLVWREGSMVFRSDRSPWKNRRAHRRDQRVLELGLLGWHFTVDENALPQLEIEQTPDAVAVVMLTRAMLCKHTQSRAVAARFNRR